VTALAPETLEHALTRHGSTYPRLEKLARKALADHCRQRGITLDHERHEEAVDHLLKVGEQWAFHYQPELAHGHSFTTSCYRRMIRRPTDYLRKRHGDERRGTPLHEIATDTTLMPETGQTDDQTFDRAIDDVSQGLTTRSLWTLHHIGRPIAEQGLPLLTIARQNQLPLNTCLEMLEQLRQELAA
jgi:hypothetical protein